MTHRERFTKTLKCEPIGGQVPTFELVFFLTMEKFGKVHPSHRYYGQWNQMSRQEKSLHMDEMAQLYIDTARAYGHSAIFVHPNPGGVENTQWLLELIREKSGDEYFIMMHGDPTWAIPDGDEPGIPQAPGRRPGIRGGAGPEGTSARRIRTVLRLLLQCESVLQRGAV